MESSLKKFNEIIGNINGTYHEICKSMGISDSEFDIYYILYSNDNCCYQSVLYKNSGLGRSTINSTLKKMKKNGKIILSQATGRNMQVTLTEEGKNFSKNTVEKVVKIENEIFDSWLKTERELFLKLNQNYLNAIRMKWKEVEIIQ